MTKRKRKDDSKPGKQYQVLMMYSELPTDAQGLKNGHILYQDKVHASKADVLRIFKDNFNIVITNNILQSLLNRSVKKYVNLAREADDNRFREICEAAFTSYNNVIDNVAVPEPQSVPAESASRSLDLETCFDEEGTSGTQPPVTPLPSVPQSPVSVSSSIRSLKRKGLLTPLMKKILEREDEMKKDVHTLKNKVTALRAKLSSKKFKQNRYLQRQVTRLYERLRIKKEKLKQKEKELREFKKGAVEVQVEKELMNAKRTIKRLKQQHKGCASKVKFRKIKDENKELKRKLKEKENTESVMEDRVLQLQDELQILMNDEDIDCREDR